MSLETECGSMNSDISKRISDFSVPNRNCASVRAISVLPTPVGPRKRNEPIGRPGERRPARERRAAAGGGGGGGGCYCAFLCCARVPALFFFPPPPLLCFFFFFL